MQLVTDYNPIYGKSSNNDSTSKQLPSSTVQQKAICCWWTLTARLERVDGTLLYLRWIIGLSGLYFPYNPIVSNLRTRFFKCIAFEYASKLEISFSYITISDYRLSIKNNRLNHIKKKKKKNCSGFQDLPGWFQNNRNKYWEQIIILNPNYFHILIFENTMLTSFSRDLIPLLIHNCTVNVVSPWSESTPNTQM